MSRTGGRCTRHERHPPPPRPHPSELPAMSYSKSSPPVAACEAASAMRTKSATTAAAGLPLQARVGRPTTRRWSTCAPVVVPFNKPANICMLHNPTTPKRWAFAVPAPQGGPIRPPGRAVCLYWPRNPPERSNHPQNVQTTALVFLSCRIGHMAHCTCRPVVDLGRATRHRPL